MIISKMTIGGEPPNHRLQADVAFALPPVALHHSAEWYDKSLAERQSVRTL
jgi:hypothetical protein